MYIIYPKSEEVDQFLVDVSEGGVFQSKKEAEDLTDKVLYFPKSLFTEDGTILSVEELKQELNTNGVQKITIYLENLMNKLKDLKVRYKLKQDYSHLIKFIKKYKKSLKQRINISILDDLPDFIVSNILCEDEYYLQDYQVKVNKTPDILGDYKVIEMYNIEAGPIYVDELIKILDL